VRAVRLAKLVVQPGAPVRQLDQVEVAEAAAGPGRGGHRAGPRRRGGDERGRVGAERDAGPLLVVLRCAGPPVVVRRDRVPAEPDGGDPGAAGVPLARPTGERGALPGPVEPVRAGRVLGGHLVGLGRVGQRVDGRPHVPCAAVMADHRVLDRPLARVAREDELTLAHVELGRVGGVGRLHPPVLGPGGRATQVEPPAATGELDQLRSLKRIGVHLLLGDHRNRIAKGRAVSRVRDRHRVAPAAADRPAQPVGEVETVIGGHRRRPASPETLTRAWCCDRD
jgi:hypothetical protein